MNLVILDNINVDAHIPATVLPETPMRTEIIREALSSNKLIQDKAIFKTPELITYSQLLELARLVHDEEYLTHLTDKLETAESSSSITIVCCNSDTQVSEGSRQALCATLSIVRNAVDLIANNAFKRAFCNIRPPGHHSCEYKSMGFCFLNNVAIAIKYARTLSSVEQDTKMAIVDIDCHHGNGTQNIFYDDPNVLYISLHQHYLERYPGTGKPEEMGDYNNVLNINLHTGSGHAKAVDAFDEKVIPKLKEFAPKFIFISCGFDSHYLDPIGGLKFTNETYTYMTKEIVQFADEYCSGKVISLLEGGYNKTALMEASVAHVLELL
jgi:acetoin utilization deacetylase AcuC-like enzyme